MSAAAAAELEAFAHVARAIEYQPSGSAQWHELRGVLRKPTTDELQGGLDRETRIIMFRQRELVAIGAPAKGDRVRGLGTARVYTVQGEWDTRWSGPNPTFMVAEVKG